MRPKLLYIWTSTRMVGRNDDTHTREQTQLKKPREMIIFKSMLTLPTSNQRFEVSLITFDKTKELKK